MLFTRPNRRLLQALINLSRQPEWKEVDQMLADELRLTTERLLDSADTAMTGKLQGRGKLLRDLQQLVLTAPVELPKAAN